MFRLIYKPKLYGRRASDVVHNDSIMRTMTKNILVGNQSDKPEWIKNIIANPQFTKFLPPTVLTENTLMSIIKPEWFPHIPTAALTRAICDKLVGEDPDLISAIPTEFVHPTMIATAVYKDPAIIRRITPKMIDAKILKIFIDSEFYQSTSTNIQLIPDSVLTQDICDDAFRRDTDAYPFIPNRFVRQRMSDIIVALYPSMLFYVPVEHITREICDKLLDRTGIDVGYLVEHIPSELIDEMLAQKIYDRFPWFLHLIPVKFHVESLFATTHNIRFIPTEFITRDKCVAYVLECLAKGEIKLKYVPAEFHDNVLAVIDREHLCCSNFDTDVVISGAMFNKYFCDQIVVSRGRCVTGIKLSFTLFDYVCGLERKFSVLGNAYDAFMLYPADMAPVKGIRERFWYRALVAADAKVRLNYHGVYLADQVMLQPLTDVVTC